MCCTACEFVWLWKFGVSLSRNRKRMRMRRSKYIPARGGAARIHSGASSFIARNLANCGGLFHSLWRREIPRIVFALLVLLGAHVARAQQAEKDPPPGVGNLGRAEVNKATL